MAGYILRRILGALLVMLAVSTLVFFMLRLVPGDPIGAMLADAGSDEAREALTRKFGFDQPVIIQFFKWLLNLVQRRQIFHKLLFYQIDYNVF